MIVFYDFETEGLTVPGVPSSDPRQPKPVSLSAILDDADGITRRTMQAIVRPDGWEIDERLAGDDGKPTAFSIHRITNKVAHKYGRPLASIVSEFNEMVQASDVLSAFNAHFDEKLYKISCALLGDFGEACRKVMESKQSICTMENAAIFLIGKKRISLKNAYFEMFRTENADAHNSLGDAMASRRIFYELKKRHAAIETKSLARKEYDTPPPGVAQADDSLVLGSARRR